MAPRARDRSSPPPSTGPGIAKIRRVPLVRTAVRELAASLDGRWRELLEAADIVSEGAVRVERGGPRYYGTTSLVIEAPGEDVAKIAASDPHLRVRAVRIAVREAGTRAAGSLARVRVELSFRRSGVGGVCVVADVVADVVGAAHAGGS